MPRLRPLIGLVSAGLFVFAGISMLSIRSISGDSVAEAFYQTFGVFSFGLGGIALLMGFVPFTADQERQFSINFKRCAECQEHVRKLATRCPFCGTDLIEAEAEDVVAERRKGTQDDIERHQ